jgi:hypothetical protein
MAETRTKPTVVADEAPETVRGGIRGHDPIDDDTLPIGLLVDFPQPGPNMCPSPFIARGRVNPTNCLLDARIVTPTGTLIGTRVPGNPLLPNNWSFSFPSDPPPNSSLAFIANANDGNGHTKQAVVPFTCGGPPPPPPPPPSPQQKKGMNRPR